MRVLKGENKNIGCPLDAIRGSKRRIEDLRDELKKALDRFEEEELVI